MDKLQEMLMSFAVNGYSIKRMDEIIKHVEDIIAESIAESESVSWEDGYEQGKFDMVKRIRGY